MVWPLGWGPSQGPQACRGRGGQAGQSGPRAPEERAKGGNGQLGRKGGASWVWEAANQAVIRVRPGFGSCNERWNVQIREWLEMRSRLSWGGKGGVLKFQWGGESAESVSGVSMIWHRTSYNKSGVFTVNHWENQCSKNANRKIMIETYIE